MNERRHMPEGESLTALLQRIVTACIDFNDEVFYHHGRSGTGDAANQRLAEMYVDHVGVGGLEEIKKVLSEIAPALEQAERERLAKSPIKSREAGDMITEDKAYRAVTAAVGFFKLLQSEKKEWNTLLTHKAFRAHIGEILQLPAEPKENPAKWGRVITEVIWHRKAEEMFHVQPADLQPGGDLYALIIAGAESACQKRKRKRSATFERRCGRDVTSFLSLGDAARVRALEKRSKSPEERDKASVRASRLLDDARDIAAISVSDAELKEALRDLLVERIPRMFR